MSDGSYAYSAKAPADPNTYPFGWPINWDWPGPPWPPGWPPDLDLELDVTCSDNYIVGEAVSIECRCLDGSEDTDIALAHQIAVVATAPNGDVLRIKDDSGGTAYSESLTYEITNYDGDKYGFQDGVYIENGSHVLEEVTLTCTIVTVENDVSGSDDTFIIPALSLEVTATESFDVDDPIDVECRILDGVDDTSLLVGETITVTADIGGATVQVSKDGILFYDEITYTAEEYDLDVGGGKYGFSESLYLDGEGNEGETIILSCSVTAYERTFTGTAEVSVNEGAVCPCGTPGDGGSVVVSATGFGLCSLLSGSGTWTYLPGGTPSNPGGCAWLCNASGGFTGFACVYDETEDDWSIQSYLGSPPTIYCHAPKSCAGGVYPVFSQSFVQGFCTITITST